MLCGVHAVQWCALLHRILCCDVCVWQLKIEMPYSGLASAAEGGGQRQGRQLEGKRLRPVAERAKDSAKAAAAAAATMEARLSCEHMCLGGNALTRK